jgi:hypothetical protein
MEPGYIQAFKKTALLEYSPTQFTHLMAFSILIELYSPHHNFTIFSSPKRENLYPLQSLRIPLLSLAPGNHYSTVCLYDLPALGVWYQWNHNKHMANCVWLLSLSMCSRDIQVCGCSCICGTRQYFILFYDQRIFHATDRPHFVCSFLSWRKFWLSPLFG